ncbi:MAG: glycoside hydrolase family 16 protein [Akkermansiaceae bacterium]|nr:glycoside hydrolase family 16 protein [Akkermansiaceae bacterium]
MELKKVYIISVGVIAMLANLTNASEIKMPTTAKLVFEEDWSTGRINPDKWYALHKRWGKGNHGVVRKNVFIAQDMVNGKKQNVLVCRGHGDEYKGDVVGWNGKGTRVGGVLATKKFFASGRYEVVMKIGSTDISPNGPKDPKRPIGMVPAIWTYSYKWVGAGKGSPKSFNRAKPMFNPHMRNEYWSEIDMPEFGKNQDLGTGLYNVFLNANHQSRTYPVKHVLDGKYHTFTSIWRTHLVPIKGVTDKQVVKSDGFWWIQDKSIPFASYRGNPLKRLGKDHYAVYAGKEVDHYIDGKYVGNNPTHVPAMAAQLSIGAWFPDWAGAAPWAESKVSVASVKVWQYGDPGDVRGVLTENVPDNMNEMGQPLKR